MFNIYALSLLCLFACMPNESQQSMLENTLPSMKKSIHEFIVTDINGQSFDFSTLKGKK